VQLLAIRTRPRYLCEVPKNQGQLVLVPKSDKRILISPKHLDWLWSPPSLLPWVKQLGKKLPSIRMTGTIPPLPTVPQQAWTGTTSPYQSVQGILHFICLIRHSIQWCSGTVIFPLTSCHKHIWYILVANMSLTANQDLWHKCASFLGLYLSYTHYFYFRKTMNRVTKTQTIHTILYTMAASWNFGILWIHELNCTSLLTQSATNTFIPREKDARHPSLYKRVWQLSPAFLSHFLKLVMNLKYSLP
jgi:hypothetical protein